MKNILEKINILKPWVISVRQDLHSTPELGLEEFITRDKIIGYLKEIGIHYTTFENHTGVVASIINPNFEKTIAIRCDIDALPIDENNTLSYKSINNGIMHACGHDAHTAILLGTCKYLYSIKDELDVNVKFLFQPAEETVGGAKLLIESGCMENPKIDYTIGLHVMPSINTGCIELQYDTMNASTDTINIKIKGKKGHGAYPNEGIDAIVCSAHVITALQTIISRNIASTNSAVLSLGMINGGKQGNIICDEVNITGTLRTLDKNTRSFIKERIVQIVKNTAISFNATSDVIIEEGYEPLVNDNFIVDIVKDNGVKLLGKENVLFRKHPSLGAEDFSFYLDYSKGAFYHLGCRNEDKNIIFPLHTSEFMIDEDCLTIGICIHVLNVLSLSKI